MLCLWQTIILSLITSGITAAIVGAFLNANFNKKLETEIRQKAEATKIAALFAKWIKYGGKTKDILDKQKLHDYFEDLNKIIFEISLWIPNEKLLIKIMERLANKESAEDIRKILIEARKLILNKKSKDFSFDKITLFPPPV
jgi:hypothetical protein